MFPYKKVESIKPLNRNIENYIMMEAKDNKLENMRKENPFRVPDGYFEGFTARMMEQIPDDEPQFEDNKVTMWDRVRPIFYLAAMFAGLGLFFKAIVFFDNSDKLSNQADSLLVSTQNSTYMADESEYDFENEENEYLQYLEDQYTEALILNELNNE